MMTALSPCRIYIVYRNTLFAQGVRSMLERESGVEIVGIENDLTRAAMALRDLQPDVILLEEHTESGVAWPSLEWASASRIVTFSLYHAYATVYSPCRISAADPSDLVDAILGPRTPEAIKGARADSRDAVASVADRLTADEGGYPDSNDSRPPLEASRATKDESRPVV